MNIKQAKDYIKDAVSIYLKKDEYGEYRIPIEKQRPIFIVGAPGIGKTAIMEQIAEELSIALVSYSMTHHTRQSALGLPVIKKKVYDGEEYDVSEYTMSEIIATVYDTINESGVKEGILFLDEINCVSETLAPSMLSFLQYKEFGKHRIPEGFIVVTAGNPPEYNKAVKEFDVVTLDRLKVIDVDADYEVWKEYAKAKGIHSAITGFLDANNEYFYHMETTIKGRSYVTARGWEDLSDTIILYEEEALNVDYNLVSQYLRNENIAREFCAYYDLHVKYKREYDVERLLDSNDIENAVNKAKAAAIDEQLSLLGILTSHIISQIRDIMAESDYLTRLAPLLREIKQSEYILSAVSDSQNICEEKLKSKQIANSLSQDEKKILKKCIFFLSEVKNLIGNYENNNPKNRDEDFSLIKEKFDLLVEGMKLKTNEVASKLNNLFVFVEEAFENDNHMLYLLTELTANTYSARFIGTFGCDKYHLYQEKLMLEERTNKIKERCNELDI